MLFNIDGSLTELNVLLLLSISFKKKKKTKTLCLSPGHKQLRKEEKRKAKAKEKGKDTPIESELQRTEGEIRKPSYVNNAKKQRKTIEWERLEIFSRNHTHQRNV